MYRSNKKSKSGSSRVVGKSESKNSNSCYSGHYMTSTLHDENEDTVEMPIASPTIANHHDVSLDVSEQEAGGVSGASASSAANSSSKQGSDSGGGPGSNSMSVGGSSIKAKSTSSTKLSTMDDVDGETANKMLIKTEIVVVPNSELAANGDTEKAQQTPAGISTRIEVGGMRKTISIVTHDGSISGGLTIKDKGNKSLKNLIYYIKVAYSSNLTSPKWKNFKGLKLQVSEKIRLNNVIWRGWFEQYGIRDPSKRTIKHSQQQQLIYQFTSPAFESTAQSGGQSAIGGSAKMSAREGKFWRARLEAITNEYKRWRELSRKQINIKSRSSHPASSSAKSTTRPNRNIMSSDDSKIISSSSNTSYGHVYASAPATAATTSATPISAVFNKNVKSVNHHSNQVSLSVSINQSSAVTPMKSPVSAQPSSATSSTAVTVTSLVSGNMAGGPLPPATSLYTPIYPSAEQGHMSGQSSYFVSPTSTVEFGTSNFMSSTATSSSAPGFNSINSSDYYANNNSVGGSNNYGMGDNFQQSQQTYLQQQSIPVNSGSNVIYNKQVQPYNNRYPSPSPGLFQDIDLYNFSSDTLFSTYLLSAEDDDNGDSACSNSIFGTNPDFFQPDLMHLYPNFDFFDLCDPNELDLPMQPIPAQPQQQHQQQQQQSTAPKSSAMNTSKLKQIANKHAAQQQQLILQQQQAQSQLIETKPPEDVIVSLASQHQPVSQPLTTANSTSTNIGYIDLSNFNTLATVAASQLQGGEVLENGNQTTILTTGMDKKAVMESQEAVTGVSLKMPASLSQINSSINHSSGNRLNIHSQQMSMSEKPSSNSSNNNNTIRNLLALNTPNLLANMSSASNDLTKQTEVAIPRNSKSPKHIYLQHQPHNIQNHHHSQNILVTTNISEISDSALSPIEPNNKQQQQKHQQQPQAASIHKALQAFISTSATNTVQVSEMNKKMSNNKISSVETSLNNQVNSGMSKPATSAKRGRKSPTIQVNSNGKEMLSSNEEDSTFEEDRNYSRKGKKQANGGKNLRAEKQLLQLQQQQQCLLLPSQLISVSSTAANHKHKIKGADKNNSIDSLPETPSDISIKEARSNHNNSNNNDSSNNSRVLSRSNSMNSLNDTNTANNSMGLTNAEQKRRCNIQHGFDRLQFLVPALRDNKNNKVSKAVMLQKTSDYIKELQKAREKRVADLNVFKAEIEALSDKIAECQSQLPATSGVALAGNNSLNRMEKFEHRFNNYVKAKTLENWRFYLFSIFLKPLFDNFVNHVNATSKENIERTFNEWQEKHCNLTQLRPITSNALRFMSRSTSILTDSSKLPEECYKAMLTKI